MNKKIIKLNISENKILFHYLLNYLFCFIRMFFKLYSVFVQCTKGIPFDTILLVILKNSANLGTMLGEIFKFFCDGIRKKIKLIISETRQAIALY